MVRRYDVRGTKQPFVEKHSSSNRTKAESIAAAERDGGNLARVVPKGQGWKVMTNPNRLGKKVKGIFNRKKAPEPRIEVGNKSQATTVGKRTYNKEKDVAQEDYDRIRRFSFIVGTVHLISGLIMVAFANTDFVISIISTFAAGPPGCFESGECTPFTLVNYDAILAYWVATFSLLSAFFHYLTIVPGVFEIYQRDLERGRNLFRWVEYSLSATVMILIIMLLSGLNNLTALVAIAGANVGMILFGWLGETMNPIDREKTDWTPFIFGCIVGVFPWIAIWGSLILNLEQLGVGWDMIPTFVWWIIISQFFLFQSFAFNHAFQYGNLYPNYLYGERVYIWLSLISKSLLAWFIFANTAILGSL